MLIAIWAQGKNGIIGNNNIMPWHLPNDLKYFKEQTNTHTLIMGRKTFEGMGSRPLPNRETIILTTDKEYSARGIIVMNDVDSVLALTQANANKSYFVAGGSEIYKLFLPHCDQLKRTWIDEDFDGDTSFPEVNWDEWKVEGKVQGERNDKNPYDYYFESYERKN